MRDQIIDYARECLGTPFVHQGRVNGIGLDCAGVVIHVMRRLGLAVEDLPAYPRHPYQGMMQQIMDAQPGMTKIAIADRSAGDVLLMRIKREPQHLGIDAGETIIHSYSNVGRVVEQTTGAWARHITAVYRINL